MLPETRPMLLVDRTTVGSPVTSVEVGSPASKPAGDDA